MNLLAFSAFPEGRKSQADFVPEDSAAFRRAAKKAKWKVAGPKKVFLVQGDDRVGAIADMVGSLAAAKINVTALDAVSVHWTLRCDVLGGAEGREEGDEGAVENERADGRDDGSAGDAQPLAPAAAVG